MQFSNWVRAALRKTVLFSPSSGPLMRRMQYAPTTGYVRSFEILMQYLNQARVALQKTVPFSSPLGPSVERMRYAPTTGYVLPFKKLSRFRPLRGRLWGVCDTLLQLGTCGPSKNCPVFVPFGDVEWAYAIRPYDRVRAILRNTDAILQLGTCGPSKNYLVFVSFGAVCGVYAIRPYNRVRAALQKMILFSSPSGPLVGRMRYAPTTGYVRPFKK